MINTGLGTFEPSEQEIGSLYNQTRTGFWESAGATFYNAWNYNPTSSVFRAVDQSQAYQSSNTYINILKLFCLFLYIFYPLFYFFHIYNYQ